MTMQQTLRHPGPPLTAVGIVYTALFVGSLVAGAVLTGGSPPPLPFGATDASLRFYVDHATAVRAVAFLQFGSAIPLGIFTATIVSRLHFLRVHAAGVTIAQFGGFAASFFLAASGLLAWVLSWPSVAEVAASARLLQLLVFA